MKRNSVFAAALLLFNTLPYQPCAAQQIDPVEQAKGEPVLPETPNTNSSESQPSPSTAPGNNTSGRTPPSTRFNPTEKILADDAVSFPVDI